MGRTPRIARREGAPFAAGCRARPPRLRWGRADPARFCAGAGRPSRRLQERGRPPGGGAERPPDGAPPLPEGSCPSPSRAPARVPRRTPRGAAAPAPRTAACASALGTRPLASPGSCRRPPRPQFDPTAPRSPGSPPQGAVRGAPLAAPRPSRGVRPPCTLEHRAASLCQLLWVFAAVGSGCRACPPEGGKCRREGGRCFSGFNSWGLSGCFCKRSGGRHAD